MYGILHWDTSSIYAIGYALANNFGEVDHVFDS